MMAIRTLLLRLLLIAAFFNAVIGIPLHEAGHVQLAAGSFQTSGPLDIDALDEAVPEQAESDGLYAWCAVYAVQETALVFITVALRRVQTPVPAYFQATASFVRQDGHWRYSARDPPLALT